MLKILKNKLPINKKLKLLYGFRSFKAFFFSKSLSTLAVIHKTDKFVGHYYTPHYQNHFSPFKYKRIKLFEIGVGGYELPLHGGNSLRMWKSYFPYAKITSLDIYNKSFLQEQRIKIYKGSQIDESLLNKIHKESGAFDIIIDDGSHINEHVIKSFQILFPKLKKGGIYVIEDTQTSYWEDYGGTSKNFNKEGTIGYFFKSLIDGLNHEEFMIKDYQKTYFDKHIVSMHFYHNLIFIYKGDNNEPSNYLNNNQVRNG